MLLFGSRNLVYSGESLKERKALETFKVEHTVTANSKSGQIAPLASTEIQPRIFKKGEQK